MKQAFFYFFITGMITGLLFFSSACRKDFSTVVSSGNLKFSKDTVYLDTVFTNIGSSTYTLKVYNTEDKDIFIPEIYLERGQNSGYRLNVDGIPGKHFENVEILAKDSLYIFIETTIDYDQVENPLYEDKIIFDSQNTQQKVQLVTLVQDAHFLYPDKINGVVQTVQLDGVEEPVTGRYLTDEELNFTSEKPYVIYGYMVVGDENNSPKTLTMNPGTRVYFHPHSGLIVNENSSLHILGEMNTEGQPPADVVLEGDRLEPEFSEEDGQWDFIWLRNGSTDNIIRNAVIKNAKAGIVTEGFSDVSVPTLQLYNVQLYNHSLYGILAFFSNIQAGNVVIGNTGRSAFAGLTGGVYDFTHCTFADYWGGGRDAPSVLLTNYILNENMEVEAYGDLVKADFTDCIVYGDKSVEWGLDKIDQAAFNFRFENCFMKFYDPDHNYDSALYDFEDTGHYAGVITEGFPDFKNTVLNEYIIGENSDCIGGASAEGTAMYPLDINGIPRANPADIGAYEHTVFDDGE